jgi:nucleoside-diphosphate-sugar epimerase
MPTLTQGKQLWDYLFVQDVARAIGQTAKTSSVQGIFNLASGHAIPIRQIVERIRDLIDPSLPLRWGDKQTTLDSPTDLRADISRLQNAIDWSPQTSLDEGLKQTVAWYRSER